MVTGAFADSSALVKRYMDEDHAAIVRELDGLAVSAVAGVEVASAAWRKVRSGQMEAAEVEPTLALVARDLRGGPGRRPRYAVIRATDQLFEKATEIVRSHSLRTLDAVQLASALMARELIPECTSFVCFDDRLRAAAADHHFTLMPA